MTFDTIVAGVGGMGSAAAWQLARRGQRVLGLERFDIPHGMGSSQAAGADIRARERVLGWEAHSGGEGVAVTTDKGRYTAARLVLAAGAWMAELAEPLRRLAVPERQVLAWLQPQRPELFTPAR